MSKKTLAPSVVTTRDKKGLKFMSITGAAYEKAALTEDEAQLVNEAPGWSDVVADFIKKHRYAENSPLRKFEIFKSLGVIEVPADYVHATRLADFFQRHQGGEKKSFYYYNDAITDANFSNPSRVVKPGDKFHVDLVRQVAGGTTSSEERMAFLAHHHGIHLGAQGASLVFDDKKMRTDLPKGKWYLSFDEKDRLWQDADRCRRVPLIDAYLGGGFDFGLGYFGESWNDDGCFLLFRDFAK